MAARRLIMVLVALMVLSTIAAALAPVRESDESPTTTTAETTASSPLPDGKQIEREIPADPPSPIDFDARRGDQLTLLVDVADPSTVLIEGLGLRSFATPGVPARFDLLLRRLGSFAVSLEDGTTVARVHVRNVRAAKPADDNGPQNSSA